MKIAICYDPSLSEAVRQKLPAKDLHYLAEVLNFQLCTQVGPIWQNFGAQVSFYEDAFAAVDSGFAPISIVSKSDEPGAAGYHTLYGNAPGGRVAWEASADNNSDLLKGPYPLSRTISHEAIELFANAMVDMWHIREDNSFVPHELADAVEDDDMQIDGIPVSNFVTPAWFEEGNLIGPFDYQQTLKAPYTVSPHGYYAEMSGGRIRNVFGERYAEHKKVKPVALLPRAFRRL